MVFQGAIGGQATDEFDLEIRVVYLIYESSVIWRLEA
jgi:hypothetical protein